MPRRGFSLVKLLVVLAIIAILIGLLLPAVAKTRAAAARARSSSNLRQFAIAIQNYDSNYNRFPAVCDHGAGSPTGHGLCSLHFQILPYIEEANVFQLYQQTTPQTYYSKDTGAAKSVIRMYLAQDDPTAPAGTTTTIDVKAPAPVGNFSGTYATTSYPVNGQVFFAGANNKTLQDGSSNTIMVAERYQICKQGDGDKPPTATSPDVYCLWGLGAYSASTAAFALDTPKGANVPTAEPTNRMFVPKSSMAGLTAAQGYWANEPAKDFKYPEVLKNNGAPGGFQVAPRGPIICDARVPQTGNTGGMLIALCDCSARSVNPSMSALTFWSQVTPGGNEVVGVDW